MLNEVDYTKLSFPRKCWDVQKTILAAKTWQRPMNSERIIEEIEAAWVQYKESEYGASLKICNIVMDELKHLAVLINGSNSEKLTFFQVC